MHSEQKKVGSLFKTTFMKHIKNYQAEKEVDPYQFALYMMGGVSQEELNDVEKQFIESHQEQINNTIGSSYKTRDELLQKIMDKTGTTRTDDIPGYPHPNKDDLNLLGDSGDEELQKLIDDFVELDKTFQHKLYTKYGKEIFNSTNGNEDAEYDYDKFEYYMRYAKMIEDEFGIEYVTCPADYPVDYDLNDKENLNELLMAGRLWIDIVTIDTNGKVNFDRTSAASDSNIKYTNKVDVDNRELKKAEAEYQFAMKKIDQKDKKFDMDLNRLETERNALTTEYDSVKKVIQDNIDRTFKIFS